MAGRPRRRARLDAAAAAGLPELPGRDEPLAEMTADERAAYLTAVRRALRDDEVRRGKRRPKTMREFEIWQEGLRA
jgi:hypothetical protein